MYAYFDILCCRVFDFERQKVIAARSELRSKAGGTGDRGHKIRTYNFPQVISASASECE